MVRRVSVGRLLAFSLLLLGGLVACSNASEPVGEPPAARVVPASPREVQLSFAPVVRAAAPAVVNINAMRMRRPEFASPLLADPFFRRFFERYGGVPLQGRRETSLGSGVIIRAEGLVVTNHHVVADASAITVITADRREYPARVLRSDADLDLAILQLAGVAEPLPALGFADSNAVEVGDLVLALGNPFGIGQSVSSGIVSATARSGGGIGLDVPLIQTDAAINPGNSGGALVGLDGRLVGINTAILTRGGGSVGVGFAIPANVVRAYVEGALAAAPAERPWLGARLQELDQELAEGLGLDRPRGTLVAEVVTGAAADRAGLAPGDVVLTAAGEPVTGAGDVTLRLALARGETVPFTVWRRGERRHLEVPVRPAPREPPPEPRALGDRHPFAGARLANLSPAYALELDRDPFLAGVIVLAVARGSPAGRLGLQPGDVIAEAQGRALATHRDLDRALAEREARDGVRLLVVRDGRRLQLLLG